MARTTAATASMPITSSSSMASIAPSSSSHSLAPMSMSAMSATARAPAPAATSPSAASFNASTPSSNPTPASGPTSASASSTPAPPPASLSPRIAPLDPPVMPVTIVASTTPPPRPARAAHRSPPGPRSPAGLPEAAHALAAAQAQAMAKVTSAVPAGAAASSQAAPHPPTSAQSQSQTTQVQAPAPLVPSQSQASASQTSSLSQSQASSSSASSSLQPPAMPGQHSTSPSPPPTLRLIQRALEHSKDGGETLDLSRERLDHIGDDEVEFFRTKVGKDNKGVWRLALSYNNVRDGCIVPSFSSLNRLRYLNLKGNQLTVVPSALADLNALEILDLSKNQIAALPETPGRLASLKVLSLSNNRLVTLPTYLVNFHSLKVFKVDHNPLEWPPREVLGPLYDGTTPNRRGEGSERDKSQQEEDLRPWIDGMKLWLTERAVAGDPALESGDNDASAAASGQDDQAAASSAARRPSVDTPDVQPDPAGAAASLWLGPTQPTMKKLGAAEATERVPSPTRNNAIGTRNRSATISEDSLIYQNGSTLSIPYQPFHHDRSVSASSLTPPASASTSSSQSGSLSSNLPAPVPLPPNPPGHSRGGSYNVTQRLSGQLTAKKSLPDLRQSHAKIIEERREATDQLGPLGIGIGIGRPGNNAGNSAGKRPAPGPTVDDKTRSLGRMGSMDVLRRAKETVATADLGAARESQEGPAIDESRNSYFRRLSMLPASTISKAVSPAMLMFIDSVRGLLFALSQLHAALRQYLNFAVSDRVVGVFARVLEPAGRYLANLINALDRFDSTSRRSSPPVSAVRGVVDAAKESVAVFLKIVAVLRLQLPAFRDADVRYTRQLLLNIYGGMGEIVCSWRTMAPLLAELKPLLNPDGARALVPPMLKSNSLTGRTPISPIPERAERERERGDSLSPERSVRPQLAPAVSIPSMPMPPLGTSPRGKSRRHAGSFSTQDLEWGMLMGSPGSGAPARPHDWADHTHGSRTIFEEPQSLSMLGPSPPPFPLHAEPEPPMRLEPQPPPMAMSQSQPARSRHNPTSSAGSSYLSVPNGTAGYRNLSVDVRPPTPASATLYDGEFIDVIETATETAFTVWLRLAEDIGASAAPYVVPGVHTKSDSVGSTNSISGRFLGPLTPLDSRRPPTIPVRQYNELVLSLSTAEHVTTTLRESVMGVRANPFAFAHSGLPEHTETFIVTVVKVAAQIKSLSATHSFSASVRQGISQLTQVTRECAILLRVSSLRSAGETPATAGHSGLGHAHGHSGGSATSGISAHGGLAGLAGHGGYSSPHGHGHSAHGHGHAHAHSGHSAGGISTHSAASAVAAPGHAPNSSHGAGSGAASSSEDLVTAPGLRGLQLPTRQAALRNRNKDISSSPPIGEGVRLPRDDVWRRT